MEYILHVLLHSLEHSLLDSLKLLPFLFVTYFLMECLEHMAGERATALISRSGRVGTLLGGILGAVPQCGFSAAAASLYSGRVITLGTLFAVFLSTSDEMLPIMISAKAPMGEILQIIGVKAAVGIAVGLALDLILKRRESLRVSELCEEAGCDCEKEGVFRSALRHTLVVFCFIFAVSLVLEIILATVGEDALTSLSLGVPVISNLISAAVGLIPNCAASVVLTELYLDGVLTAGALTSGLLTGAGVGLLVLFKTNKSLKENLLITLTLWATGAFFGVLLDLVGFLR